MGRFDNEFDRTPATADMYVEELREIKVYMRAHTDIAELKALNVLGAQFAHCEASKYFFYRRYESGPIYKPRSRDFVLTTQAVLEPDEQRHHSIRKYWVESVEEPCEMADELHPDHRIE